MKILVVNGFIRAAVGDAALLGVMVGQLAEAFPDAAIVVSTLEDPEAHPEFEGHRNIGSSRRFGASERVGRARRAARKAFLSAVGRFWFVGTRPVYRRLAGLLPGEVRTEFRALEEADLVVSVGGGYLNGSADLSGNLTVDTTLLPLKLAERLGKVVICGPQSYGPFGTRYQERAARTVLGRADKVLAREDVSVEILAGLGLTGPGISRQADSAFALEARVDTDWRDRLAIPPGVAAVGLTARLWLDPEEQSRYERRLAKLVDHIQRDPGYRVVMIPQVISELAGEDDRMVNRRVAAHCTTQAPILIDDLHDYRTIKDLYRQLDFVVGMRFHSVIFALTSLVPAIAIGYHHKAAGIMADLGLQEWMIPMEALEDGTLEVLFDKLRTERAGYVSRLESVLPDYIAWARTAADTYRAVYEAAVRRSVDGVVVGDHA